MILHLVFIFLNSNDCPAKFKSLTVETFSSLSKGDATHNSGGSVTGGWTSTNDFAELMSNYASYLSKSTVQGVTLTNRTNGESAYVSLNVGTYLVLPYTNNNYVYAVMVDSVELDNSNGSWEIKDGAVYAKASNSMGFKLEFTDVSGNSRSTVKYLSKVDDIREEKN